MIEPVYAMLALALAPMATQYMMTAITTMAWILCITVVRMLGLHYEVLTEQGEESITKTVISRASAASWSMTTRAAHRDVRIGAGLFISRKYQTIGWLDLTYDSNSGSDHKVYVLSTQTGWTAITCPEDEEAEPAVAGAEPVAKPEGRIVIYYGYGSSYERSLRAPLPLHIDSQMRVVQDICEEVTHGVCALLCGPAGTGKTAVAESVALTLSARGKAPVIIRGFNPTRPNVLLYDIIQNHTPRANAPLILCLDEFDIIVDAILGERIQRHKHYATEVIDKASLSSFLDRLASIPHLTVIATSNQPRAWWDEPAHEFVSRRGRFDMRYTLDPITGPEATAAFLSGAHHYGMDIEAPEFIEPITAAQLGNAFRRARGDVARLYQALEQPMLRAATCRQRAPR